MIIFADSYSGLKSIVCARHQHPAGGCRCGTQEGTLILTFGMEKKQALERCLDQATYLHGGQNSIQIASNGKMTFKQLCDLYLQYQHLKVLAEELVLIFKGSFSHDPA